MSCKVHLLSALNSWPHNTVTSLIMLTGRNQKVGQVLQATLCASLPAEQPKSPNSASNPKSSQTSMISSRQLLEWWPAKWPEISTSACHLVTTMLIPAHTTRHVACILNLFMCLSKACQSRLFWGLAGCGPLQLQGGALCTCPAGLQSWLWPGCSECLVPSACCLGYHPTPTFASPLHSESYGESHSGI